jgi:hypothetical protein
MEVRGILRILGEKTTQNSERNTGTTWKLIKTKFQCFVCSVHEHILYIYGYENGQEHGQGHGPGNRQGHRNLDEDMETWTRI